MKTAKCLTACRHCRFYTPEGRRGGQCEQLNVPVQGGWGACSLGVLPFAPSWESFDELLVLHKPSVVMEETLTRPHFEVYSESSSNPISA